MHQIMHQTATLQFPLLLNTSGGGGGCSQLAFHSSFSGGRCQDDGWLYFGRWLWKLPFFLWLAGGIILQVIVYTGSIKGQPPHPTPAREAGGQNFAEI